MLGIIGIFILSAWWFTPSRIIHNTNDVRKTESSLNHIVITDNKEESEEPPLVFKNNNEISEITENLHRLEEKNDQLQQKLTALEKEIKLLKENKNANENIISNTAPYIENKEDRALSQASRNERRAQKKYQFEQYLGQLNSSLQEDVADEVKKDVLQQKIQDALSISDPTGNVVLDSTSCNATMCKIELSGKPSDNKSAVKILEEHAVFDEDVKILTVPNGNNAWTMYISAIQP